MSAAHDPLDAAAETRLLLAKAASLSEKNSGSTGELFTKLLRELHRLREENATLATSLASEKAKNAKANETIDALKSAAASKGQTADAQLKAQEGNFKSQIDRLTSELQASKAEALGLNNQVLALKLALKSSQAELAAAQEKAKKEKEAADAALEAAGVSGGAAGAAGGAGKKAAQPSQIDVLAKLAGIQLTSAAEAQREAEEAKKKEEAEAAAAAAAATAAANAAADRVRIATLEKRLRASESRVDEANARIDALLAELRQSQERVAEADIAIQDAHKRAEELVVSNEKAKDLAVTNEQLKAQLLSMLQQQESISLYLGLMLDTPTTTPATTTGSSTGSGATTAGDDPASLALALEGASAITGSSVAVDDYCEAVAAAQRHAAMRVVSDYTATAKAIKTSAAGPLVNAAVESKTATAPVPAADKHKDNKKDEKKKDDDKKDDDDTNAALKIAKAPLAGLALAFGGVKNLATSAASAATNAASSAASAAGVPGVSSAAAASDADSKDSKKAQAVKKAGAAADDIDNMDFLAKEALAASTATSKDGKGSSSGASKKMVAEAVKQHPWLKPVSDKTLFAMIQPPATPAPAAATASSGASASSTTASAAAEPSFVPVPMLSHRVFTHLWRAASFATKQAYSTASPKAQVIASLVAERSTASNACLSFADLPSDATRELSRIPGLLAALETDGCDHVAFEYHEAGSSKSSAGYCLVLDEAGWDKAVSLVMPGDHKGTLLLFLCDRMRVDISDLAIPLSAYIEPFTLLDNDDGTAIQEHLFVALAARCWGTATVTEARDAVKEALTTQRKERKRRQRIPADLVDHSDGAAVAAPAPAATATAEESSEASKKKAVTFASESAAPAAPTTAAAAVTPQYSAEGFADGYFTLQQVASKVPSAFSILSAYPEISGWFAAAPSSSSSTPVAEDKDSSSVGPRKMTIHDGSSKGSGSSASTKISLLSWHAFFNHRASLDTVPQLLHLYVALRRILRVPTVVMASPEPVLTKVLERTLTDIGIESEAAAAAAAAAAKPAPKGKGKDSKAPGPSESDIAAAEAAADDEHADDDEAADDDDDEDDEDDENIIRLSVGDMDAKSVLAAHTRDYAVAEAIAASSALEKAKAARRANPMAKIAQALDGSGECVIM